MNEKLDELVKYLNGLSSYELPDYDAIPDGIKMEESINFIENLRAEVIERLCSEILDEQFETEQGRPAFQKILKPNSKQN